MVLVKIVLFPLARRTLEDIQEKYPPQQGLSDGLLTVAVPLAVFRAAFPAELAVYMQKKGKKGRYRLVCAPQLRYWVNHSLSERFSSVKHLPLFAHH